MAENLKGSTSPAEIFIGNCIVKLDSGLITRDGEDISINPRTMSVLLVLVESQGELVTGQALLERVWPANHISSNTVYKAINELREAFGDDAHDPQYIETKSRKGYRLIAEVQPAPSEPSRHQTSFGTRAIQLVGASLALMAGLYWIQSSDEVGVSVASPDVVIAQPGNTVALLRFYNVDGDPDVEYLADSFPSALESVLSHLPKVQVSDPLQAVGYSVHSVAPEEIALSLGVSHIFAGDYHQAGTHLEVSGALYDGSTGDQLFVVQRSFPSDEMDNVAEIIALKSIASLEVHLDPDRADEMHSLGTGNAAAYLAYKEGRSMQLRGSRNSKENAVTLFRKAIELDPGFIEAYHHLAVTLGEIGLLIFDVDEIVTLKEEVIATREAILRMVPDYYDIGMIRFSEARLSPNPWHAMEAESRKSILEAGHPSRPDYNYVLYADYLMSAHLFEEAAAYIDIYARFNPEDPNLLAAQAAFTSITRGPFLSIPMRLKVLEALPDNPWMYLDLIAQLGLAGEYEKADEYLARMRQIDTDGVLSNNAWLYLSVYRGEMTLNSVELENALSDLKNPGVAGVVYMMLGDIDRGLSIWRAQFAQRREVLGRFLVFSEQYALGRYVDDPRYQQYLNEVGFGTNWTAFMREKVAELARTTGVQPSDPSKPQLVYSG